MNQPSSSRNPFRHTGTTNHVTSSASSSSSPTVAPATLAAPRPSMARPSSSSLKSASSPQSVKKHVRVVSPPPLSDFNSEEEEEGEEGKTGEDTMRTQMINHDNANPHEWGRPPPSTNRPRPERYPVKPSISASSTNPFRKAAAQPTKETVLELPSADRKSLLANNASHATTYAPPITTFTTSLPLSATSTGPNTSTTSLTTFPKFPQAGEQSSNEASSSKTDDAAPPLDVAAFQRLLLTGQSAPLQEKKQQEQQEQQKPSNSTSHDSNHHEYESTSTAHGLFISAPQNLHQTSSSLSRPAVHGRSKSQTDTSSVLSQSHASPTKRHAPPLPPPPRRRGHSDVSATSPNKSPTSLVQESRPNSDPDCVGKHLVVAASADLQLSRSGSVQSRASSVRSQSSSIRSDPHFIHVPSAPPQPPPPRRHISKRQDALSSTSSFASLRDMTNNQSNSNHSDIANGHVSNTASECEMDSSTVHHAFSAGEPTLNHLYDTVAPHSESSAESSTTHPNTPSETKQSKSLPPKPPPPRHKKRNSAIDHPSSSQSAQFHTSTTVAPVSQPDLPTAFTPGNSLGQQEQTLKHGDDDDGTSTDRGLGSDKRVNQEHLEPETKDTPPSLPRRPTQEQIERNLVEAKFLAHMEHTAQDVESFITGYRKW